MRHRPPLTPTMRLIINAIRSANNQPLSYTLLAQATGASIHTITKCAQKMTANGQLIRSTEDTLSVYSIPEGQ